ncbi:lactate utilization protein [Campylobacter hominis]
MSDLIRNLKNNGFEVVCAANADEALKIAKNLIKSGDKIGLGGSESVREIGLLDYVVSLKDVNVCNQYEKGISMDENVNRRRNGLLADIYFCSTNAVTLDGFLVNVDGSGNRVAALNYGPKKVVIIAGKNKIVKNLDEAIKRLNEVAIPKNIERLNKKAESFGKTGKYTTKTIARKYSIIESDADNRILIILVDENLGY